MTANSDGTARIWDAETGVELRVLEGHNDDLLHVLYFANFSPDGKRIVTANSDGTARIWDAETGVELRVLEDVVGANFSPHVD